MAEDERIKMKISKRIQGFEVLKSSVGLTEDVKNENISNMMGTRKLLAGLGGEVNNAEV